MPVTVPLRSPRTPPVPAGTGSPREEPSTIYFTIEGSGADHKSSFLSSSPFNQSISRLRAHPLEPGGKPHVFFLSASVHDVPNDPVGRERNIEIRRPASEGRKELLFVYTLPCIPDMTSEKMEREKKDEFDESV
ncbi:hypothetical protein OIU79_014295 [Salix purpurea]|uniref:Uncharacterized protein n=1 Tax=Salix purpurea TaxID=77065 RepID=A0A9Q0PQ91_SALPP|nr:hypothetical protein OIU79_014295 [Salix purpurea]